VANIWSISCSKMYPTAFVLSLSSFGFAQDEA
jgi:hypothetical protein